MSNATKVLSITYKNFEVENLRTKIDFVQLQKVAKITFFILIAIKLAQNMLNKLSNRNM